MKNETPPKSAAAQQLRRQAEAFLKNKARSASESELLQSNAEAWKLIHELEVHQIELEMQNEQLLETQAQASDIHQKYYEFTNFAPLGYLYLNQEGGIMELNLCMATMLGKSRSFLLNKRFGLFVSLESRVAFNNFLEHIFNADSMQSCELNLITESKQPLYVQLSGMVYNKAEQCILSVVDLSDRKKVELALLESQEKFKNFFELIPSLAFIADIDSHFLQINTAWSTLLGYSEKEILDKPFMEFVHPHDKENTIRLHEEYLKQGKKVMSFENRYLKKDGGIVWLEWTSQAKPEWGIIFGIARDITKRKEGQEKLQMEHAFRTAIESSLSSGIVIVDDEGKQTYVNPSFCAMVGWSEQELIGKTAPFVYWSPEHLPEINKAFRLTLSNKAPKEGFELMFIRKDGSMFPAQVIISPFIIENKTTGWLANVIDITERKTTELALKNSEALFQQFMQHCPSLVYLKDEKLRLLKMSKSLADLLGQPEIELLGKDSYEHFPVEFAKSAIADDMKVLHEGAIIEIEEFLNGRHYSTIKFPIHSENNKTTHIAGFTVDITERKQAEEQLKESEAKYQFIAEYTDDLLFTMTPDYTMDYVSPSVSNFLGYTVEEHLKLSFSDFLTPESGQMIRDEMLKSMTYLQNKEYDKLKNKHVFEIEIIRKDKSHVNGFLTINVQRDDEYKIIKIRGRIVDITGSKKSE
ncbi:MAG: PAS domain S-box protein [Bacteroidota bacterium]